MRGMGSGVAFVLAANLLHPRPKAIGVDFSTVELVATQRHAIAWGEVSDSERNPRLEVRSGYGLFKRKAKRQEESGFLLWGIWIGWVSVSVRLESSDRSIQPSVRFQTTLPCPALRCKTPTSPSVRTQRKKDCDRS